MSVATVGGMGTAARSSSSAARAMPLREPAKAAPRRVTPLRLVPKRRSSAARTPFVVVIVSLLVVGLLGLLLLNLMVQRGSFELHTLSKQGRALDLQEQTLSNRVQGLQAPGVLAQRAASLGMVPGGPPAFLQLPSGRVLGEARPGVAPVTLLPAKATTSTASTASTASTTSTQRNRPAASKPATSKPATSKPDSSETPSRPTQP